MNIRLFLIVAAAVEIATGIALLSVPSPTTMLLLGVGLDSPAAIVVGRVAGAAQLAIGLSCGMESSSRRSDPRPGLIPGLLVYNTLVPIVFVSA